MESSNNTTSDVTKSSLTNSTSSNSSGMLPLYEKVGYGFGDTASNIMYQAWSFFLAKFYTDIFGIPAKHAATMFLVTRVWDMINDPLMGMIADRTKTRWGKFRPYLLWIPIPYGILIYMMFITPEWGMNAKLVYAYATYILATMAYTAVNIPYSSLMAVLTPDPRERTTVSQYRFFFAFVGMLLITTFMLPLVKFFGGNEATLGYRRTFGVFGILAVILFLITFLTTRERVQPAKEQKNTFGQDIKDIIRNMPWFVLFIASVFFLTHNHIRNSAVAYYFDYVNREGSKVMLTWNLGAIKLDFDQTTVFLTIQTFGMMAGVFISTPIKKYFDKKTLMIFLSLAAAILGGVFYWLPSDNFILLGIMNFLWAVVAGATPVFLFSMFTDVADFHEWKFGFRATGLVIAGIMFAIKMGVALGGFLLLKLLDVFGYVANQPQTPQALRGIKLLLSLIPAGFILVCGIILFFYPISEKLLTTIETDLKQRKSNV
ncbi:MAG: MFS transporter [Sedimentisphaerales bacterium]|nr:MFS transporter [Sedimentisphaerales bacterium]